MVTIYKVLTKNDRFSTEKTTIVVTVDNYREALERIESLKIKNNNPNITFITGNIYR